MTEHEYAVPTMERVLAAQRMVNAERARRMEAGEPPMTGAEMYDFVERYRIESERCRA